LRVERFFPALGFHVINSLEQDVSGATTVNIADGIAAALTIKLQM
jgi:hypothetical protein